MGHLHDKLTAALAAAGVDGLASENLFNIRYCSGFSGTLAYMLLTADDRVLLVDHRYIEQARQECAGFTVLQFDANKMPAAQWLAQAAQQYGIKKLGFEQNRIQYSFYTQLAQAAAGIQLTPCVDIIENCRASKSPAELATIRKGMELTDRAFRYLLAEARVGLTEQQLCRQLEAFMLLNGSDERSFSTILNSGVRTSMPHGRPTSKELAYGDAVTVDFGVTIDGYHTDCTRTFFMGEASPKQREIYQQVLVAQETAIRAIKAGVAGKAMYAAAKASAEKSPYYQYFSKGLGHGVGLEIHEKPFMRPSSTDMVPAGSVVTVEPGIYIPGFGGTRVEDMLFVTQAGNENLTLSSKEIFVVGS